MKNILYICALFLVMFSKSACADSDFFDDLIIDENGKKQVEQEIEKKEGKQKASELLDQKLEELKFIQKKKKLEEPEPEPDPADLYDPAPFGLYWLAPQKQIEKLGVILKPQKVKDAPNSFLATNLPKPVNAFENVVISFGENDILWRIASYGKPMDDDLNATNGLKEYKRFYIIFDEKYGNTEEFYTPAVINVDEEILLKDGTKSHVIKQKFIEKGDDNFKEKLMKGESTLYATFHNDSVAVTLALMANGDGQTFIMVDYKNLKANEMEHEKMLDAL